MSSMFTDKQAKELVGTSVFIHEDDGRIRTRTYGTVIGISQVVRIATKNGGLTRPIEDVSITGDAWWDIVSKGVV